MTATVAIGVFSLFHPHALDITAWGNSRVELTCAPLMLEGSTSVRITSDCAASGHLGAPADFMLIVPGKLRRHFQGTLHVYRATDGELIATVTMALETAVAAIVAAESPPNAAAAMLEAQAIVARSYLVAGRRHQRFDFCDTTHCQFLRDPPVDRGAASRTAGQVLSYHGRPLQAFYAARCDGLLAPVPNAGAGEYPYFAVKCEFCRNHPVKRAAKSNARPHHHGMCQLGAEALARRGWNARRILEHYYPGADLR